MYIYVYVYKYVYIYIYMYIDIVWCGAFAFSIVRTMCAPDELNFLRMDCCKSLLKTGACIYIFMCIYIHIYIHITTHI